jgi:hypothetical protein
MTVALSDPIVSLLTKKDLDLFESKLLKSQDEIKNELIKWMIGLSFIQMGLYLSVVLSFHGS